MLNALRLPGFAWIAAIYSLDYVVELASSVALMVLVYDATDSPLAAAAMLTCKQVLPGLIAGSLGARLEQVRIGHGLAVSYVATAATLALLSVVGHGPLLYLLAVVAGTSGIAVRTLLRTAVARSTIGHARRSANALLNILMGVVALVGPAIGALLVSSTSITTTLIVLAAAAGVLAASATAVPSSVSRTQPEADAPFAQTDETGSTSTPDRRLRTSSLLIVGGTVLGLFAMDEPALLAYTKDALDAGVGGYGAILTAWGAGMILGSATYAKLLGRSMPTVFAASAAVTAAGYLGLGLAPTITWACALSILGGAGNGVLWVALVTAVQENTDEHHQASAAARLESIATATPAVGVIAGGVIAELISPRASLLLPGTLALLAIAIWLVGERQRMRPVQRHNPSRSRLASDVTA